MFNLTSYPCANRRKKGSSRRADNNSDGRDKPITKPFYYSHLMGLGKEERDHFEREKAMNK